MLRRLARTREAREPAFWRWFAERSADYLKFTPGGPEQDDLLHELRVHLSRVHSDIRYEIGLRPEGAQRELIISADGYGEVFPSVQALIAAAPELPGWKFTAFRQREDLGEVSLCINDVSYSPESLWFALRPEAGVVGVDLYIQGLEDAQGEEAGILCFHMLTMALGEFDLETRVGNINTFTAPEDPAKYQLRPFSTFPVEFDALFARMTADA